MQLEVPQHSGVGSRLSPGNLETLALHKAKTTDKKTPQHFGNPVFPIAQLLADRHIPTRKFWPNESQSEGSRALGTPNPVLAPALLSLPSLQSSSSPWTFIPHPGCCYLQFLCCQECKFLSFHQQNWETFSHLPDYFLLSKFVLFSRLELGASHLNGFRGGFWGRALCSGSRKVFTGMLWWGTFVSPAFHPLANPWEVLLTASVDQPGVD